MQRLSKPRVGFLYLVRYVGNKPAPLGPKGAGGNPAPVPPRHPLDSRLPLSRAGGFGPRTPGGRD